MKSIIWIPLLIAFSSHSAPLPFAPTLDAALKPFTDSGSLAGLVVGVRIKGHTEIRCYGESAPGASPSADTLFEIASLTKTFTGLLLAQLAVEGKLSLDDPVQKFMPAGFKAPSFEGREITLLDLATHTSSLPVPGPGDHFLPSWHSLWGMKLIFLHLAHWDFSNPLLGFSEEDIYRAVSSTTLKRAPGTKWEYSNLGMGLLGLALARAAGVSSYGELLHNRIAAPLGMSSTWTELPEALESRVAQGHNEAGAKAARMKLGPLAAAGGLKSSASDLMKYLEFQMGKDPAVRYSHAVRRKLDEGGKTRLLPLAWHDDASVGMLHHSGTAGGFHSWMGFIDGKDAGLFLLSNSAAQVVEEIGPELLKQLSGLPSEIPKPLVAVKLDGAVLDAYAGSYLLDKQVMTISRDGDHLLLLWDGKKPTDLWPRGDGQFFCKEWDCRLQFKSGGVTVKMYYNSYWAPRRKDA